jgi:hypothetical protein
MRFLIIIPILLFSRLLVAQNILERTIPFSEGRYTIQQILDQISNQGEVQFSYVRKPFNPDSVVTMLQQNNSVESILNYIFQNRFSYLTSENNIILYEPNPHREKQYQVSGTVRDSETGERLNYVSIYDRVSLSSAMTDVQGSYQLKLRDKGRQRFVQVMVSKEFYRDTVFYITPGEDYQLDLRIRKSPILQLHEFEVTQSIQKSWHGQHILSEELKRQTNNIGRFFATRTFQGSILPGIGSHGKMSGQVVNRFSLNLIGGYSSGLNGFEMAGGFNIIKGNAKYGQVAGIFNSVGGSMSGAQISGGFNRIQGSLTGTQIASVYNFTTDSVQGVQSAGGWNQTDGFFRGLQIAGLYNKSKDTTTGAQIAGLYNIAYGNFDGVQISGMFNRSLASVRGLQITSIFNKAGYLHGVQIGLINFADTSKGVQIGLVNINKLHGFYQATLVSNDNMPAQVQFKSGRKKLYTIVLTGGDYYEFSIGFGGGTMHKIYKKWHAAAEFTSITSMNNTASFNTYRFQALLIYYIKPWLSLQGGPSYSLKGNAENLTKGSTGWQLGLGFIR